MRLLPLVLVAALFSSGPVCASGERPRLHNSASAFAQFWDANKGKPRADQVAAFKATVAPAFPGFYSAERLKGMFTPAQYDELVKAAIEEFPLIRARYLEKAGQFEADLPKYVSTFKAAFPAFQPPEDIYVLHSLGEMDGGIRRIDGKDVVIFGVDSMVKYHGAGRESAFFHHELFHVHHRPAMSACGDMGILGSLWAEGLAGYVSKVLNPDATEEELSLVVPNNMAARTRAVLPKALEHLEGVLESSDPQVYADLFNGRDDTGELPKRRGYYLGYLVAQEAGKTKDVGALASLPCDEIKGTVVAAVRKLRAAAR